MQALPLVQVQAGIQANALCYEHILYSAWTWQFPVTRTFWFAPPSCPVKCLRVISFLVHVSDLPMILSTSQHWHLRSYGSHALPLSSGTRTPLPVCRRCGPGAHAKHPLYPTVAVWLSKVFSLQYVQLATLSLGANF